MDLLNIPGFEFIEKIGQGGMAVVWKARQLSLDRIVAIKFLQPQLVCDANEVDRLLTEARSAAKLKHVGIVQVYDANLIDGVPYVIMEYIAGYNVGDWVRRKGQLDERDALLVAECVATALDHAWTVAGIIHCDIKPDNVMVDRDGTIKVADLGLARTIGPRSGRMSPEEIMGTPSYISPEQSRGDHPLDCRTDIYSLGTMLYHLVTGRRLFEQYPDLEAMDRQITDQEPDLLDLNPAMSQGLAWLIEKMLAKDRENRQPDWNAVLKDIAAVQAGRMPVSPILTTGQLSTVKRSSRRHMPARRPVYRTPPATIGDGVVAKPIKETSSGIGKILFYVILALAGAGVTLWGWRAVQDRGQQPVPLQQPVPVVSPSPTPVPASAPAPSTVSAREDKAKDVYEYVRDYAIANPTAYGEIIEKYRNVAVQTKGTRYAMMAEEALRKTRAEWQQKIEAALTPLREQVEGLCRSGHWREAADQWEGYSGVWAQETLGDRQVQARAWRAQAEKSEADLTSRRTEEDARFERWLADLAKNVVTSATAPAVSNAFGNSDQWPSRHDEMMEIQSALTAALNADTMILESYRSQIGQTITVSRSKADKITFELQRVDPKALYGEQPFANGARIGLSIPVGEIALAEKLQRLGTEDVPDACLAKGLLFCQAGQFGRAAELFGKIKPPLGPALVHVVGATENRRAEEAAAAAALRMLKQLGLNASELDSSAGLTIRNLDESRWQDGLRQLAKYQEMYGTTTAGRKFAALWDAARQTRATPQQAAPVAEPVHEEHPLPAAEGEAVDWDRVQRSLLDRNPGLKSESIQMEADAQGRPLRIIIRSSEIQDAGSLEVCDSVQDLVLSPAEDNDPNYREKIAGLRSLAPLRKMPLRKLNVAYTLIDDLKPLANSRLVVLNLRKTGVADLGPLLNCPLEEIILSGSEVKSLAPLRGKNLHRLEISDLKINDLSPISGKPLKTLEASQTGIRDLNPLRGMPLVRLNLSEISAFDFAVLKTLTQVESLDLAGTQFKDLSLCRQMPLHSLRISKTKISDLTQLKEMTELKALDIADTPVRDLDPLRLLPLERINLTGSKVVSLVPLQKMQLRHLELARTQVRSIEPLQGQPLDFLNLSQTEIQDLSALKKMPLKWLSFNPKCVRDYEFLKRHPTLEELWLDGEIPQSMYHTLNSMPYLRSVNGDKWRH